VRDSSDCAANRNSHSSAFGANRPASPITDTVPLNVFDNTIRIAVMIGGHGLDMVLDTGATHGSIPAPLAAELLAEGAATEGPEVTITNADNSTRSAHTVIVNTLTIGTHTVHNVRFNLAVDGADPLLGLRALSAFGKFSIDAAKGTLTFG
jgi:predicted aspartyl protease